VEEVHDAADDDCISMDQRSFRSVSTFDLPSPALSSRDADKADKKTDKMSWVWQFAEKRDDPAGGTRIYCLVPRCTQKKGWASMRGSTTNIRNHLRTDHKLNEKSQAVRTGQPGPIEDALATQGKRSSAHFSTDALERQVCKILVRHKLPYSFVQSSLVQELLEIAHSAPSMEDLKLPSNDTISRRVSALQWTLHNMLNLLRLIFFNN
jgi:hypothetical protein